MSITHNKLNEERSEAYRKPPEEEQFLERFNSHLTDFERESYQELSPSHPFLFIIGAPRSGTTLLSQLIAHCTNAGFINNLAARFWKAPVTGIKFAKSVLDDEDFKAFQSHYGATAELGDIHEFGYFWRKWLKKDSFENIKNAQQVEKQIDWQGLKTALANMQAQFQQPMVFKNIFGSYHIPKLNKLLGQTLWISIERDPLDTAVSILQARKKYYDDADTWWSYVPPNYQQLVDHDHWHQIAGQVHYLRQFYREEFDTLTNPQKGMQIDYEELCRNPEATLQSVIKRLEELYAVKMEITENPPSSLEIHRYDDHPEEKDRFRKIFNSF